MEILGPVKHPTQYHPPRGRSLGRALAPRAPLAASRPGGPAAPSGRVLGGALGGLSLLVATGCAAATPVARAEQGSRVGLRAERVRADVGRASLAAKGLAGVTFASTYERG